MASYFVTGVSSGIGRSFTEIALESGHRVTGISRRLPANIRCHEFLDHWQLDLSEIPWLKSQVQTRLSKSNRDWTTVILNAAELGPLGDISLIEIDQMSHMFNTNVWANKVLLDSLLGGISCVDQVIAISSGAATEAKRGLGGYCLSKATFNMLIQLYALEYPHVHFSCLLPGTVDTDMQKSICAIEDDADFPVIKSLKRKRMEGRLSSSDDVARRLLMSMDILRWKVKSGETLHIDSLISNPEFVEHDQTR